MNHGGKGAGLRPRSSVLRQIVGRERAGAAGTKEGSCAHIKIKRCEDFLWQPRNLKEKDVPAPEHLARARIEKTAHDGRVRDVQYGKFCDAPGMQQSGTPGDCSAPIVAGEEYFLLADLVGDGNDIGDQLRQRIRSDTSRLAAQVVPALVGHNDAETCVCQRNDLFVPPVPKFGKAMKKNDDRAIFRTRRHGVNAYTRTLKINRIHGILPGTVYPVNVSHKRTNNLVGRLVFIVS